MSAVHQQRRKMTAREGAAQLGVSPRTIKRIVAEPRQTYLESARQRQDHALALKESGLKYREIGERLGVTPRTAEGLVHRAKKRRAEAAQSKADAAAAPLPGQVSIDDELGNG